MQKAETFDTAAAAYDRWRPGYPAELYRDIFSLCPVGPGSRALEVGIGTGQATKPVLETGCAVHAVEPGANLAAFVREKYRTCGHFSVENARFEDAVCGSAPYDLIYSATAFHWVAQDEGYRRAWRLLKPGGLFARFRNHPCPDPESPALYEAIQAAYRRYMPGSQEERKPPRPYTEQQARALAECAPAYGFTDAGWRLYHRVRSFRASEYVGLLGTYSDHLALPEGTRRALWDEIGEAIETHGGTLRLLDTIDLETARKPE